jgi:hypothetical protein
MRNFKTYHDLQDADIQDKVQAQLHHIVTPELGEQLLFTFD